MGYLRGNSKVCLCFENGKSMLKGCADAVMGGDPDSRKSTSCFIATFAGGAIS